VYRNQVRALGSDNIGVYVPLFANSRLESLLVILGVFLLLVGVWCYVAYKLTTLPAIALMGFGVAILRLRAFHPPLVPRPGYGWKLGLLFSLVGLLTVFLSTWQYFVVRRDIDEDIYEPADRWVVLFSLAVTLLGAGIIYFVLTSSLISRKKNKFNARYLMLSNFRKF
jgi:uncharacterized membrane protein YidH (DUF202 family)